MGINESPDYKAFLVARLTRFSLERELQRVEIMRASVALQEEANLSRIAELQDRIASRVVVAYPG